MDGLRFSGHVASTHKKGAPSGSQHAKHRSLDQFKLPTHAASQLWRLIPTVPGVAVACQFPVVFPQWVCNALQDPWLRWCDDEMVGGACMPDIAGTG